jgi:excisionase family DNA binding protein
MPEKFLEVSHVATRLGCNRKLVYKLIRDGELKAVRLGKRSIRISEDSYLRFLRKNEVDPLEYCQ